jgi:Ser/Thr protein kinase RdoA (MazF antagonist)
VVETVFSQSTAEGYGCVAQFPTINTISETWGIGCVDITPLAIRHNEQVLVQDAAGAAFVLKHIWQSKVDPVRLEDVLAVAHRFEAEHRLGIVAARPLKSDGKFILNWNDENFYLTSFIDGYRPSFTKFDDVTVILRTLARLHARGGAVGRELSVRLDSDAAFDPRPYFYVAYFEAQFKVNEVLDHTGGGICFRFMKRYCPAAMAQVDRAREIMDSIDVDKKAFRMTLCHGDPNQSNYLFQKRGKTLQCFMIDIDTIGAGCAVNDIVVPLQFLGYYKGWSIPIMRRVIDAYLEINPLSRQEIDYLMARLMLPHMWVRSAKGKWHEKRSHQQLNFWIKWMKRSRSLERQRRCVEELIRQFSRERRRTET